MYDLHSDFDINQHKVHYINYLEVIITEDGILEYAVPSHQEKLISVCCDKLNITRTELNKMCPKEYYFNFIQWLCNLSGYVAVWDSFYISSEHTGLNKSQIDILQTLKQEELYKGDIY